MRSGIFRRYNQDARLSKKRSILRVCGAEFVDEKCVYIGSNPSWFVCLHRYELKKPTFGSGLTRPGAGTCHHSE